MSIGAYRFLGRRGRWREVDNLKIEVVGVGASLPTGPKDKTENILADADCVHCSAWKSRRFLDTLLFTFDPVHVYFYSDPILFEVDATHSSRRLPSMLFLPPLFQVLQTWTWPPFYLHNFSFNYNIRKWFVVFSDAGHFKTHHSILM